MRELLLAAGLLALTVGCSQSTSGSSSSNSASGSAGSGAAGSNGGSGSTGAFSPFVGEWEIQTGSGSLTQLAGGADGGNQTFTSSASTTVTTYWVTFSPGANGTTMSSLDNQGCQLTWVVSGSTLSLPQSSSCTISTGSGCSETFAADKGSVTLTVMDSMHLSGTGMLSGTLTLAGPPASCEQSLVPVTAMGTATWVRASGS